MYGCFTKASSSCSTHGDWLNGFSFFIEKLSPHLKKIAFYTVEIGFKVEADPALLALAYAVSIVVVVVVHFRVVKLKNAKRENSNAKISRSGNFMKFTTRKLFSRFRVFAFSRF